MINVIMAMDFKGCIGKGNGLPWEIPLELKLFKERTMDGIVVMGRNTYESIGKALPGRVNVVMTNRELNNHDVKVMTDINDIIKLGEELNKTIWIIGGKNVYEQWFDLADEYYISMIPGEYNGDIYYPLDYSKLKKVNIENHKEFTVFIFKNKLK